MTTIKGYKAVMTGKDTPSGHLDVIEGTPVAGRAAKLLRKANKKGLQQAAFFVSDKVTFGIINGSRTTE